MNWGTKIVLGMLAFMLFIIAMVAYMFSVHGSDALVEEDYYEKGINYSQQLAAEKNVIMDQAEPKITKGKFQLVIQLKDSASYELKLMRPSSKKDDTSLKGSTIGESNLILLDTKQLPAGLWYLELQWKAKNKVYLLKKQITL